MWEENQSGGVLLFVHHAVRQGDGVASVKHNRGRGRRPTCAGIWFFRGFRCGGGCVAGALRQSHTCGGHVHGSGHGVRGSLSVMAAGKAWLLGEGTGDQASTGASGMGSEEIGTETQIKRGNRLALGDVSHPSTPAPTCAGGVHRPILHNACRAYVGAILIFQDARPVRGRVDGRSDTPVVSQRGLSQERPTGSRGTQPQLPYPGTKGGVCTPIGEGGTGRYWSGPPPSWRGGGYCWSTGQPPCGHCGHSDGHKGDPQIDEELSHNVRGQGSGGVCAHS